MPDDEKNETTEEPTEPTPEEPAAEAPAEDEGPSEEPTAEEAEPQAEAEAPAEEPAAEAEPEAEAEAPAEEPTADAVAEEPADEAAEADSTEEAAPAQPVSKPKRKRLPRSERHKHVKPKRERPAERKPITRLPKPEAERGRSVQRRGVVVSAAMDKTIVVRVDSVKSHPRYKKVIRRSAKFHAHDEQNQAKTGDVVRIVETRPLSKTKRWRLAEIVEVAK